MNKYFILLLISMFLVGISSANAALPLITDLVDGWHFTNSFTSYRGIPGESVVGTIATASDKNSVANNALATNNPSNSCGRWNITSVSLNDFTVCEWVKGNSDYGTYTISSASKHAATGIDTLNVHYNYDGYLASGIVYANGDSSFVFPNGYNTYANWNSWHFVCVTYNKTGGVNGGITYINGVAQPTKVQTYNSQFNITHLVMGCRYTNGATFLDQGFTNGYIDEVTIWNRVLSTSEISSLYSAYDQWEYYSPSVSLITPANNTNINSGLNNFTFYVNASDLGYCSMYLNKTNYLTYYNSSFGYVSTNFTPSSTDDSASLYSGQWLSQPFRVDFTGIVTAINLSISEMTGQAPTYPYCIGIYNVGSDMKPTTIIPAYYTCSSTVLAESNTAINEVQFTFNNNYEKTPLIAGNNYSIYYRSSTDTSNRFKVQLKVGTSNQYISASYNGCYSGDSGATWVCNNPPYWFKIISSNITYSTTTQINRTVTSGYNLYDTFYDINTGLANHKAITGQSWSAADGLGVATVQDYALYGDSNNEGGKALLGNYNTNNFTCSATIKNAGIIRYWTSDSAFPCTIGVYSNKWQYYSSAGGGTWVDFTTGATNYSSTNTYIRYLTYSDTTDLCYHTVTDLNGNIVATAYGISSVDTGAANAIMIQQDSSTGNPKYVYNISCWNGTYLEEPKVIAEPKSLWSNVQNLSTTYISSNDTTKYILYDDFNRPDNSSTGWSSIGYTWTGYISNNNLIINSTAGAGSGIEKAFTSKTNKYSIKIVLKKTINAGQVSLQPVTNANSGSAFLYTWGGYWGYYASSTQYNLAINNLNVYETMYYQLDDSIYKFNMTLINSSGTYNFNGNYPYNTNNVATKLRIIAQNGDGLTYIDSITAWNGTIADEPRIYITNLSINSNNTFTNINITESGVWNVKCFSADNTFSAYAPSNYTFLIGATAARNIFGFITPNTQVRLLNPQTLVSTYATSNATGYFTFNDLAIGNYIIYTYSRNDYGKIPEVKYVQVE